ncbi:MAG: phasin family protein [Gammaproteobacteria bacterium]|nr:phasin family protein [Gammaproteobacteria bacterium]
MTKKSEHGSSQGGDQPPRPDSSSPSWGAHPLFSESHAESIWLAGLAFYQKSQEEGGKAIEKYFKDGQALTEKMQANLQKQISQLYDTGNQVLQNTGIASLPKVGTDISFLPDNLSEKIWQVGILMFQNAQKDGNKVFDEFCKEGKVLAEKMQANVQEQLNSYTDITQQGSKITKNQNMALGEWGALTQIFDHKVASSLQRLAIPTHEVVKTLQSKIDALENKCLELQNHLLKLEHGMEAIKGANVATNSVEAPPAETKPTPTKSSKPK